MQREAREAVKLGTDGLDNKGIYRRFFKRPMDFIVSLMAIIFLGPVLVIIALLVRVKLGSPVLFRQIRPGLNEKLFTMYKFRTMTNEKDENGELLPDSARLTRFGRMLRSTSLDELPELFNILRGDMSIVGPRPLLERYLPYYTEAERLRHDVRPGLSGLAQINGRNDLDWDRRLELDVEYARSLTFIMDIRIIAETLRKAVGGEGVNVVDESLLKDLDIERSQYGGSQEVVCRRIWDI